MANMRRSLLIGVNGYPLAFGRLEFCVSDAKKLEEVLSMRRAGFHATESILLTDDQPPDLQPGRNNIIDKVKEICEEAKNGDTVIIFFSGHGTISSDNRLYLLPIDVRRSDIQQTALSWQWIKEEVEQSRARYKIIILDACHSGAGKDIDVAVHTRIIEEVKQGVGFVCFTSCSGGEVSYELTDLKQGIFSHYLVRGISGAADPLGRRVINVAALYDFVREGTLSHAKRIKARQTPRLINNISEPLEKFIIAATDPSGPIKHVLVLTEDPLFGHFLETGIKLNHLVIDATWARDLEQVITDALTQMDYDVIYLDVRSNQGPNEVNNWEKRKELIHLVEGRYPTVSFVFFGVPEIFWQELDEQDQQKFGSYSFFDLRGSMTMAATFIAETLTQAESYIKRHLP